jgi:hypothetical protein
MVTDDKNSLIGRHLTEKRSSCLFTATPRVDSSTVTDVDVNLNSTGLHMVDRSEFTARFTTLAGARFSQL